MNTDLLVMVLLLIAIALASVAQIYVRTTFTKYSSIANRRGLTGAEAAQKLLSANGIYDVRVMRTTGFLSDHYDPRNKTVCLSENVFDSKSLAALGIASHETGHAIQHAQGYVPLSIRSAFYPVVMIGSRLASPLIFIGLLLTFLSRTSGNFGIYFLYAGIVLYSTVVLFHLITLPVEFNASSRAIDMLEEQRILDNDEISPARKMLNVAALTYVAAAAIALLQLLRFILLANRRR